MPQIIFLPHDELCPEGKVIEAEPGVTVCDAAWAEVSKLNMHVKSHVPAQPVMSLCAKVLTAWKSRMSWKTICLIKHGVWSQSHV